MKKCILNRKIFLFFIFKRYFIDYLLLFGYFQKVTLVHGLEFKFTWNVIPGNIESAKVRWGRSGGKKLLECFQDSYHCG